MSPELLHILQHSLGRDQYGRLDRHYRDEGDGCFGGYRNRYVSDPTPDLLVLVGAGLMADHGAYDVAGGMHYYRVTKSGFEAMIRESPRVPKLTRAQIRYRDFLSEDCVYTFGEWLKLLRHRKRA